MTLYDLYLDNQVEVELLKIKEKYKESSLNYLKNALKI